MRSYAHYNPSPPANGILCTTAENYEHIIYPHYHRGYEISIILSGAHRFVLEHEQMVLRAGDMILLRPYEAHSRFMDAPGKCVTITFLAEELIRTVKYLKHDVLGKILWGEAAPVTQLSTQELERQLRYIEHINLNCDANPELAYSGLRMFLVDICFNCFANSDVSGSTRTPWLSKLLREMEQPENIRRGLQAMLELTPYSHEYLCREFRRMVGCTPTEYINSIRLKQAHNLLENPQMSIADICYSVGFESISYFYRLFKNKYGSTPSRYRKMRFISRPKEAPEQRSDLSE